MKLQQQQKASPIRILTCMSPGVASHYLPSTVFFSFLSHSFNSHVNILAFTDFEKITASLTEHT